MAYSSSLISRAVVADRPNGLRGQWHLRSFCILRSFRTIAGVVAPSYTPAMARKASAKKPVVADSAPAPVARAATTRRPSALIDTRVIYCGDNLEQLAKLPDGWVDLIYIDPPFNSNRNYEVF